MYKSIIKAFIKKLTLQDIIEYSNKCSINLDDYEASIILNYIKNDYETIIYGNPNAIFNDISSKIGNEKFSKIESLYYEFKEKYKNYL